MIKLFNAQQSDWKVLFKFSSPQWECKLLDKRIENQTLLIGLGEKNELDCQKLRRAGAFAVNFLKGFDADRAILCFEAAKGLGKEGESALAEGALLATFQPESWKQEKKDKSFSIYAQDCTLSEDELNEISVLVEGVFLTRHLANRPGNMLTPELLAEEAVKLAKDTGIESEIFDEKQIEAMGMGAFFAVGGSSGNPPRLIVLRYNGAPESNERMAFVGKGLTFDTGGYCLKPGASMPAMRGDMAGAAAVLGAVAAAAKNKLKANVIAVIPAAENRISEKSYLPGDVITSMNGKTIYVGNTDAEGRLLLADGITYAIRKEKATHVIDIATLTGAVNAAFGGITAGAMSNNDDFYARFDAAAKNAGENYWLLPSFDEYKKMIESPQADLSNISNDGCGTITAGLFLEAFSEDVPWIHLDIAGTSWVDSPKWEYQTKFATGAGVTSLYNILKK